MLIVSFEPDLLGFAAQPSLQDIAFFMAPRGGAHSSGQYSGGRLCSSCQQALQNTVQTFLDPYAYKEFATHLPGTHAPAEEPGFGFCQQHPEFPSSLPFKYYAGSMLLNFALQMRTGVSNMAWSADVFSLA